MIWRRSSVHVRVASWDLRTSFRFINLKKNPTQRRDETGGRQQSRSIPDRERVSLAAMKRERENPPGTEKSDDQREATRKAKDAGAKRRKTAERRAIAMNAYKNQASKVSTPYGQGQVLRRRDDGSLEIRLSNWLLNGGANVMVYMPKTARKSAPTKKFALIIAYNGKDYCGLQINPDVPTIEAELQRAIHKAGLISDLNYGNGQNLQKIRWGRAARTDKGVHAAGNVVSMKLFSRVSNAESHKDYPSLLNVILPPAIRVVDCVRVVGGFQPRRNCHSRTYEYMLPLHILQRSRDRTSDWSVIPDEWASGVRFAIGRRERSYRSSQSHRDQSALLPRTPPASTCCPAEDDDECEKYLRIVLSHFEGSHLFHNYTRRLSANDAQSRRVVRSFTIRDRVVINGMTFLRLVVHGQSFVLNQIRKMVAMAVYITRGILPLEALFTTFSKYVHLNIPMAPAEGLLLSQCHFEDYNRRYQKLHGTIESRQGVAGDALESFKQTNLYPHIASTALESSVFESWLSNAEEYLCAKREKWIRLVRHTYYWTRISPPPKRVFKKKKTHNQKESSSSKTKTQGGGKRKHTGGKSRFRNKRKHGQARQRGSKRK